jgi:hypothetical protein
MNVNASRRELLKIAGALPVAAAFENFGSPVKGAP